jgi:adenylate kinase family enzyme
MESDCRVNGWVLEGFPTTRNQLNLLSALKITPTSILVLD